MTVIEIKNVSRWYGNVVAVNDITMDIGPGVTGLLGPKGAGKSPILPMIAGFLAPSRGTLTVHPVLGEPVPTWRNPDIYRSLGLVPEGDSVYAFLTGHEFVSSTATLHKPGNPAPCPKRRRPRIQVAPPLVPHPAILLLDAPFNGMDPRQRIHMMELLAKL